MKQDEGDRWIDASSFQSHVETLAITLTHKVEREGVLRLPSPNYAVTDLGVLLRQATYTYDLIFFLHCDEIRSNSGYRLGYSFASLPLIRTMIDCLYNITAILDDPITRAPQFRKSGYRQLLQELDEEERLRGDEDEWREYLLKRREHLALDMRSVELTEEDVRLQPLWPTLSTYIRSAKNRALTPHQAFLKLLTFGYWAEYSSISHATFQGLKQVAPYFLKDRTPHEHRDLLEERGAKLSTKHLGRSAGLLLCIVSELQAYFHFRDANIDARLSAAWEAMMVFPEVGDLFKARYCSLLRIGE